MNYYACPNCLNTDIVFCGKTLQNIQKMICSACGHIDIRQNFSTYTMLARLDKMITIHTDGIDLATIEKRIEKVNSVRHSYIAQWETKK